MIAIQVKNDIDYTVNALKDMGKYFGESVKYIVRTMSAGVKKRITSNMYQHTGRRNGWLKKHVYSVKRSPSMYVVSAPRHIAEALEKGTTIHTKKSRWLTFKTKDGSWHKVKSVTIPPSKWYTQSYDGFEDTGDYKAAIEKGLQLAIKRFDSKRAAGLV